MMILFLGITLVACQSDTNASVTSENNSNVSEETTSNNENVSKENDEAKSDIQEFPDIAVEEANLINFGGNSLEFGKRC